MKFRRRYVVAVAAIAILLLVAAATFSVHRIRRLSLPISQVLGGFTVALPISTGFFMPYTNSGNKPSPQFTIRTLVFFLILVIWESVVATLAGIHLAPQSALTCELDERWLAMFRQKDVSGIRAIQDFFNCCGLHSVHDKAWPFPDKSHDINSCSRTFGRTTPCFEAWRSEEQRTAGWILVVSLGVFLWKCLFLFTSTLNRSRTHPAFNTGDHEPPIEYRDEGGSGSEPQGRIASSGGSARAIEGRLDQAATTDVDSHEIDNEWARN